MKGLLMEAASIAVPKDGQDNQVLGAKPLFKSWVDKGLNAAGWQAGSSAFEHFRSTKKSEYNALMNQIGTTMLAEILNETTKTVSDGDRRRVEDLVGAYASYDGTVGSHKVLMIKLKNLEAAIDVGMEEENLNMSALEKQWGTTKLLGGGKPSEIFSIIRSRGGKSFKFNDLTRTSKPIYYKDIINMKTRTFTPKFKSIFGKRA